MASWSWEGQPKNQKRLRGPCHPQWQQTRGSSESLCSSRESTGFFEIALVGKSKTLEITDFSGCTTEAEQCSACDPGGEHVEDDGGEGGMDGGGVGRTLALPRSGTTWVFTRGSAGESPAAGDGREDLFAIAPVRSGCFGVSSCSSATRGVGGGGGGGGVDGRGNPGGSSGGGGCAGVPGVAARLQERMMDLTRKACAFAINAACNAARARDLVARADVSERDVGSAFLGG